MGKTKFHKPSKLHSSNLILDKCTFWSHCRDTKLTQSRVDKQWQDEFLLQRLWWKGCSGRAPRCGFVYTNNRTSISGPLSHTSCVSKINLESTCLMLMLSLRKISRVCLCSDCCWKPQISNYCKGKLQKTNKQRWAMLALFQFIDLIIYIFSMFQFSSILHEDYLTVWSII